MNFLPAVTPPSGVQEDTLWFFFQDTKLLVREEEDAFTIPHNGDAEHIPLPRETAHYLGTLGGTHCYSGRLPEDFTAPDGYSFHGLRTLYTVMPDELTGVAGRAFQVLEWDRTHRFCGACGKELEALEGERARTCTACSLTVYPRITPATITAVLDGNRILLAHNSKFPEGLYSLVAGFVEAGESLEECVRREVKEEVGVDVGKITYFGSQPWPFPHSLMVGFFAEYAGGKIVPDGEEIQHAAWFTPETLPNLPGLGSISRQIIETYMKTFTHP